MNEFLNWCDERTHDCMARKAALSADGRGDEARFMQIRANVYGIFRSVCVAMKGDVSRLMEKVPSIPAAWETALNTAEAHGDTENAHIERIKLETSQSIRHYVSNLQEGKHD